MDIQEARALVQEKTTKDITARHLISVEGVMRRLAQHFGEDEHRWALTGLFHDLDQDITADDPERHANLAASWLKEREVDAAVVNGVLAHAHAEYQTDLMSRSIVAADAVAGLLVAAALVRPEKAVGMKVASVKKKLKESSFAPGVNRDEIRACSDIGLDLDTFIGLGIEGLQLVAADIGLA
ncbi:MAG TPA: HD domain-containing protein [Actinomycetota bacterium]|nr:HD domain-containing protein [Actinomycetota bacterium]